MHKKLHLSFLLVLLCIAQGLNAQNCGPFTSNPNAVITNDTAALQDTIFVNLSANEVITQLSIGLRIQHDFMPDLDISLQSPSGTTVPLIMDRCAGTDSLLLTFSDTAAVFQCDSITEGTFMPPDGMLSDFNNELARGNWILSIIDDSPGDDGILIEWCLLPEVTAVNCLAPRLNAAQNITDTSALISWNEINAPPSSSWDIAILPADSTFTGVPTATGINVQTFQANDLLPGVLYAVYVRADCVPVLSPWSNVLRFRTAIRNGENCGSHISIPNESCNALNVFDILVENAPGSQLGVDVNLAELRLIIEHPWAADIDMWLTSPSGKKVEISTDNGSSNNNYGILPQNGDCSGYTIITAPSGTACNAVSITEGTAPFIGTYFPEGNLEDFRDSSNPNGVWELTICDDSDNDFGFLEFVELTFSTALCETPTGIAVDSVMSNSAIINWIAEDGCQQIVVEYGESGFTPGTGSTAGSAFSEVVLSICNPGSGFIISGLSELTEYDFYVRQLCAGNQFSANSCVQTFTTICQTSVATLQEDFDAQSSCATSCFVSCGLSSIWQNSANDDIDWLVDKGGTGTPNTGPSDDVSGGGNYVYIESSSPCNAFSQAVLQSECLAVPSLTSQCNVSFYYHMFGTNTGTLEIQLSINDGLSWTPLWTATGDQGNEWNQQYIDLSFFANDTVQLRFLATKGDGSFGDIALDQISLYGLTALGEPDQVFFRDLDEDGFGNSADSVRSCRNNAPLGYSLLSGDCNDGVSGIFPGAEEVLCNGIDENCNGMADDSILPRPLTANVEICLGESAVLQVLNNAVGEFFWYEDSSSTVPFANGHITSVTPNSTDTFYIRDELGASCMSDFNMVIVKVNQQPVLITPSSVDACFGHSIQLQSLPAMDSLSLANISYHSALPPSAANQISDDFILVGDTVLYISASSANCQDIDSITIISRALPEIQIAEDTVMLCSGKTAKVSASVASQFMPVSFIWSNGLNDSVITVIGSPIAGSEEKLFAFATDTFGCVGADSILVQTADAVNSILIDDIMDASGCDGSNGAITLTPINGQQPYYYAWDGPVSGTDTTSGSITINNLSQGAYRITITDNTTAFCPLIIPVIGIGGASFSIDNSIVDNVSCNGENDGSIEISTTGGNPSFLWSNDSTGSKIENLSAGFYNVTITQDTCEVILNDIEVTEPTAIELSNINIINASCNDKSDGSITVAASGGNSPYLYEWTGGSNGIGIANLDSGKYELTVTDIRGCKIIDSFTVFAPPALVGIYDSVQAVSCFGLSDGAIYSSAIGGTPPYGFSWTNNSETDDILNLTAGAYQLTVTDANGCADIASAVAVNQPAILDLSVLNEQPPTCNSASDGSIELTAVGGTSPYSISWNIDSSGSTLSNLSEGIYRATVTDAGGCNDTISIVLIAPQLLNVSLTVTQASCIGLDDGSIAASVSGGSAPYSFDWGQGNQPDSSLSNLSSGSYSLTVTDANGCFQFIDNIAIIQPQLINIGFVKMDVNCAGDSSGFILVNANGGAPDYSFSWQDGGSGDDRLNLPKGSYSVTVTDANGCKNELGDIQLEEPDSLQIQINSIENILCSGQQTGSIDIAAFGGIQPYRYVWDNGSTQEDLSSVNAGIYKLTVFDENNCFVTSSPLEITEPQPLEFTSVDTDEIDCNGNDGGSIDVNVEGGTPTYTFRWSNNSTKEDLSDVPAGTYSLTVTDQNDCKLILPPVQVIEPADSLSIALDSAKTTLCFGQTNGFIAASIEGGNAPFSFLWSNGIDTSLSIDDLPTGSYMLTVTDSRGCIETLPAVTISSAPPLTFAITDATNPSCFGLSDGSICAESNGGTPPYDVYWLNSLGDTVSNINCPTGLMAGQYQAILTDTVGCQQLSVIVSLQQPAEIMATAIALRASCPGQQSGRLEAQVVADKLPVQVQWNDGNEMLVRNNVDSGQYWYTLTDANGCTAQSDTATVIILPGDTLTSSVIDVSQLKCRGDQDGSIELDVQGGVPSININWSNGQDGLLLENLQAGCYIATISDSRACQLIDTICLTEPAAKINFVLDSLQDNLCAQDSAGGIWLTLNGGIGSYEYMWSNGDTTASTDSLQQGFYRLTVVDENDCEAISPQYYIDAPPLLQVGVLAGSSGGPASGSVAAIVIGGSLPYQFEWNDTAGSTDSIVNGLENGWYTVTVTDANDCMAIDSGLVQIVVAVIDLQADKRFTLFPNPFVEIFNIQNISSHAERVGIEIYDTQGKLLMNANRKLVSNEYVTIDMRAWPSGMYFVKLRSEGQTNWHKCLKR